MHRLLTIFAALVVLAAACSGGGSADPPVEPAAGSVSTPAPEADQQARAPGAGIVTIPLEFDQADLLACSIGALPSSQLVVAYAEAAPDVLGPNADRFRVLVDDYLDRCGGDIEVRTFNLANVDACDQIAQLGPALTVTDAASAPDATCIAERSGAPLWHEAGLTTALVDRLGTTVVSTDVSPDVGSAGVVTLVRDEGLLEGRSIAVVHASDESSAAVATDGLAASLPDAELLVVDVGGCGVGAPDAEVVFTVVSPACLSELVAATSGSPLWVIIASDEMLADSSAAVLETVNEELDGALAYAVMPVNGGGWPRVLGPNPRDKACNQRLDFLLGTSTPYPSISWSAGARLCATTHAVLQALGAAGDTPDALAGALTSITDVPLPRDLVGATTPDEPWLAGAEMFSLEWSSDCVCWNFVAGPLATG